MTNNPVPSLAEFKAAVRAEFGFLAEHGFAESPPVRKSNNPFEIWFRRASEAVIVAGESYGSAASASVEHVSGVESAVIYLVSPETRPPRYKRGKREPSQLEQVGQLAAWLRVHGEDILGGDLTRFFRVAKPLPPWKARWSVA